MLRLLPKPPGSHWVPIPCLFQIDMHMAATGEAKITLLVPPKACTLAIMLSKKVGLRTPPADCLLVWMNSTRPPAVPRGLFSGGAALVNERAPKKPIASHFFLCSRALRLASLAGSLPPYLLIWVSVRVKPQVVRVIWVKLNPITLAR